MMKEIKLPPYGNKVTLSGEVYAKDEFVNYIPYPLFGFEIKSFRPNKKNLPTPRFDEIRVIVIKDEQKFDVIEVGKLVSIDGEMQSRNFLTEHELIDESIQTAVEMYMNFYKVGEYPTSTAPTDYIMQAIEWDKLLEYDLLEEIPHDSVLREGNVRERDEVQMYLYKVDINGEVHKYTEHTTHEVIAHKITVLEEPLDPIVGDKNEVVYQGRVSRAPFLDVVNGVQFSKFSLQSKVRFFEPKEERMVFLNVFGWGKNAAILFNEVQEGDFLCIKGRIQTRRMERPVKAKKQKEDGKIKTSKYTLTDIVRDISISSMAKNKNMG